MPSIDIYSVFSKYPHNTHYLNRYLNFVLSFSEKIYDDSVYTEQHHICPRSLFPEYKSFSLNEWNKVILPSRAHFIAHWMLSKVFTNKNQMARMLKAVNRMGDISSTNYERKYYLKSKHYAISAKSNSEAMKICNPMHNVEIKKKSMENRKKFFSTPEGIEIRKQMTISRTGVNNITPEGINRLSELWTGVSRPKTATQIQKNRESTATKLYHTPFGSFISVSEIVANRPDSVTDNGPALANMCKNNLNGYSIEYIKKETRGTYERLQVCCAICGKITNPSNLILHFNSHNKLK